jgi:hypothetical protein
VPAQKSAVQDIPAPTPAYRAASDGGIRKFHLVVFAPQIYQAGHAHFWSSLSAAGPVCAPRLQVFVDFSGVGKSSDVDFFPIS